MKSIYVNGCSFSAGHKELQDRGGKAWPDLLKNHFHVRNDSMNGGSSFRALRQCIDVVKKQTEKRNRIGSDVDTVICQLTAPERSEVWFADHKFYMGVLGHRFLIDENNLEFFKNEGFNVRQNDFTYTNSDGETIEDKYHFKIKSFNETQLTRFEDKQLHILGLCNNLKLLCKQNNIKLLFTAMSERCIPNYFGDHIMTPKFTKPMSHIVGVTGPLVESEEDRHPNEAGHKEIYRYILSELEKL